MRKSNLNNIYLHNFFALANTQATVFALMTEQQAPGDKMKYYLSCGVAQPNMAPLYPTQHLVESGGVLFLKHPSAPSKKLLACGMIIKLSNFYLKFLWTTNISDWLYDSN